jgi:DNA-binding transcriptional LysR family regulator
MADGFRAARIAWEDVRFFAAVARQGSLAAAARALSVNQATLARRLAAFEQSVGTNLFSRSGSSYALTSAGQRALRAAEDMESAARALARFEPEAAPTGLVRITATRSLAEMFLIPRLGALLAQHPALDLEVVADQPTVSLAWHQPDVTLRLGRPEKGGIGALRLGHVGYRFVATRAWRDRISLGIAPRFVGFDETRDQSPEAVWLTRHFPKARVVVRCNDHVGQSAAARAGCGIAMLPCFLAGDPALMPIELSVAPMRRELWLLTRPDAQNTPRIGAVARFLIELVRRERAVLEGSNTAPALPLRVPGLSIREGAPAIPSRVRPRAGSSPPDLPSLFELQRTNVDSERAPGDGAERLTLPQADAPA